MWRAKQLSLAMQLIWMRQRYPSFRARVKRGQLVAIGDLVPSKQSRTYRIKLLYALRASPRVYVIAPDLSHLPGGDSLPHVYPPDNQLCLYLPGNGEWTQNMFLADTIVPWASEWLLWSAIPNSKFRRSQVPEREQSQQA